MSELSDQIADKITKEHASVEFFYDTHQFFSYNDYSVNKNLDKEAQKVIDIIEENQRAYQQTQEILDNLKNISSNELDPEYKKIVDNYFFYLLM